MYTCLYDTLFDIEQIVLVFFSSSSTITTITSRFPNCWNNQLGVTWLTFRLPVIVLLVVAIMLRKYNRWQSLYMELMVNMESCLVSHRSGNPYDIGFVSSVLLDVEAHQRDLLFDTTRSLIRLFILWSFLSFFSRSDWP